ncbi:thioredoxin [bacterium]|nr:thioredoxin [bacterium]
MAEPIKITDDNFETEVLKSDIPIVIDFWAEWCRPCLIMAPVLEDLATDFEGKIKIGKINVDNSPRLASQYQIRGIPTLLFFDKGQVIDQVVGVVPKDYLTGKINQFIGQ